MLPTVQPFDRVANSASDCALVRLNGPSRQQQEGDLAWEVMIGLLGRDEDLLSYASGLKHVLAGPLPFGRRETVMNVGVTKTRLLVVRRRDDLLHFETIPLEDLVTVTEEVSRQQFGASIETVYRAVTIRVQDHEPIEIQVDGESEAEEPLAHLVSTLQRLIHSSTCVFIEKRIFC